eukprot:g16935.t1
MIINVSRFGSGETEGRSRVVSGISATFSRANSLATRLCWFRSCSPSFGLESCLGSLFTVSLFFFYFFYKLEHRVDSSASRILISLPSTSSSSSSTSTGTNPNISIKAGKRLDGFKTAAAAYNLPTWLAAFRFSDPSVASNDAKSIAGNTDKDNLARRISRQWNCTTALAIFMKALAEGILVSPSKTTTGGADSSGSAEEITMLRQELADQKLQLDIAKRRADESPAFGKDGRTGPSAAVQLGSNVSHCFSSCFLSLATLSCVGAEFPPEVPFSAFQSGNTQGGQQHSLAESQPKNGFKGYELPPCSATAARQPTGYPPLT